MRLSLIAAVGKNNELGKNNDLIWKLKGDMQFFREMTKGHLIIMGRKTFESLPKLLPGRKHLVLTRGQIVFPKEVTVFHSREEFLKTYENTDEEIFDIGGASIYKELLDYASLLYLTEINATDKDATVYFPNFDKNNFDREELAYKQDEETGIQYKHVLYKRKNYDKG